MLKSISADLGRFVWRPLICSVVLATLSLVVFGQAVPTGSISGTVSDESGSLVPNATVVIKSAATNAEYTVQTSDNGTFTVPSLATGSLYGNHYGPKLQADVGPEHQGRCCPNN